MDTSKPPGYPLHREAAAYRRELPRLLAEGEAWRFALFKGDDLISIWDTQRDALQYGRERYGLEPIAVIRIDPRDPQRFAIMDEQQARREEQAACPK